jgi:hypothetical protein
MTDHILSEPSFNTIQDLTQQILSGAVERADWTSLRRLFSEQRDKMRVAAWHRLADWARSEGIEWRIESRGQLAPSPDATVVFRPRT